MKRWLVCLVLLVSARKPTQIGEESSSTSALENASSTTKGVASSTTSGPVTSYLSYETAWCFGTGLSATWRNPMTLRVFIL